MISRIESQIVAIENVLGLITSQVVAIGNQVNAIANQGVIIGSRSVAIGNRLSSIESILKSRFGDIEGILRNLSGKGVGSKR